MTGGVDLHPMGQAGTAALLAELKAEAGMRVLEVGCGTGVTLVEVAARTAVALDGLEPSPVMRQMARRRLRAVGLAEQVGLYGGDGRMLPFAAESYHRVYMESVLGFQQVGDAAALLAQIFRVLRPGGLFIANEAVWQPEVTAAQTAAMYARNMADFGISQAAPQPWSVAEWLALMQSVGLSVIAAEGVAAYGLAFPPMPPHSPQLLRRSQQFSRLCRWQSYVRPDLVQKRLLFRGRLKAHEGDGRLLESRLFVLQKP
ncbi:MAG: methyltransferase domain-containing protein [Ardenticatenaceae bacterium]|nr:methyltransferase domain-containing protein [Ardenticatenaceae bacterium]